MRFLGGGVAVAPALISPGTKDSRLSSVKSANAISTTPITSRLMCEEGEAAPRASPRLAEVVTAMIAMLAQGIGHFKRMGAEVVWIIPLAHGGRTMKLCSLDARSGGQSRPPPWSGGGTELQLLERRHHRPNLVSFIANGVDECVSPERKSRRVIFKIYLRHA